MQSLATTDETLTLEPFADKWRAFGWDVVEIDGHDHARAGARDAGRAPDRPRCVLAHTTKGKGVSFMEDQVLWHYRPPSDEELARALEEIREMRTRFFADLVEAARTDPDLVLITGDLGFGVIEPFVEACPDQFINAGVAEQNMTGMAAGIALAGGKVFTYSIANFPTLRCLEQIRNDIAYHGADVTVVAVGGGLAYGALGMSHHATEDLAIMRSIPGMAVAAPGDPEETSAVLAELLASGGPAYLRLGKAGEPTVHDGPVVVPRGTSLRSPQGHRRVSAHHGRACCLQGPLAAQRLEELGISCSHISMPWLAPLDSRTIQAVGATHRLVVTLEEHSVSGGLGGAAAEVLAEVATAAPLLRLGLPHEFSSVVGDQEYLRARHGLTPDAIADRIAIRLKEIS